MLDIQTDPSGASVSVDGKPSGMTPLIVKGLSIEHPVTIEVTWPGTKPQSQTVDWGGHDLIRMRLKKSGGDGDGTPKKKATKPATGR